MRRAVLAALAVLVLANIVYLTWTRGGLALFGSVPASLNETEPHRIGQQIRPELLQIVPEPPR